MKDIISTLLDEQYSDEEFKNEITELMDLYLVCEWRKTLRNGYCDGTYMLFDKVDKGVVVIRFPGATRGHIEIDEESIIKKIVLYPETREIYKKALLKELDKYIGYRLIIPK
jgi:hypothetical protein